MSHIFSTRPKDPLDYVLRKRGRSVIDMVDYAIKNNQLALAYQPVVYTKNPKRAAFYEGLIRVIDENGEIIPAAHFIDEVETRELGRKIDCASLKLGLDALNAVPNLRLSINMSARSIGYPEWMDILKRALANNQTIAERLILEITEGSAISMPEIVSYFMADMHSRGVSFALDDFGSGYTAFRFFRDFQFDILKIDGQFSKAIARKGDNQVLVTAFVAIAEQFDMFVVCEHVETGEDLEFLARSGVDCAQGYFTGRPKILNELSADNKNLRIG